MSRGTTAVGGPKSRAQRSLPRLPFDGPQRFVPSRLGRTLNAIGKFVVCACASNDFSPVGLVDKTGFGYVFAVLRKSIERLLIITGFG